MKRKIEFNAWIPELEFMLEDVTYGHAQIGFPSDYEEFNDALKSKGFDPEEYKLPDWLFDTGEDWYYINEEKVYILLQFTGLTDKNGVDIYEGNIVNQFDLIVKRPVVYINGAFGYYDTDGKHKQFIPFAQNQWYNWSNRKSNNIEVIGNIYENPELLKSS
jgi:hypothetical protein